LQEDQNDQEFRGEEELSAQGEEDEDQLVDIDNLDDNEKAILIQYLQNEYQKNPDQLPMPKEVIEKFLEDNQELIHKMNQMQQIQEGEEIMEGEEESPE
jgi:hypothetical protein